MSAALLDKRGWTRRPVLAVRVDAILPTTTAQAKMPMKLGDRVRLVKKAATRRAEAEWWHILAPVRAKLAEPLAGAVYVRVDLVWPFLKATSKRALRGVSALPKVAKPDCDNLCKLLLDTMTRQEFWRDDAIVSELTVSKWHASVGGLQIEIGNIVRDGSLGI